MPNCIGNSYASRMRFNTPMMVIMFTAFGSGCIEAPETVQWSGESRQDLSVTNATDAQNEPDLEAERDLDDMAPVVADASVTDDGIEPDSRFLDGSPDASCTPSDEVCDGLDNNCSGEIDEDNVCLCERDMDPLFYICMVAVHWQQARMACAAAGDGLAVIETAEQNQMALALTVGLPENTGAWIGLNDIETEGNFVWYDMNPAQYRAWRVDMPDNSGEEDCVEVQVGGWNDFLCDATRPFICREQRQN